MGVIPTNCCNLVHLHPKKCRNSVLSFLVSTSRMASFCGTAGSKEAK